MYNEKVKELRGIGKYQLSYEEKHQTLNAICEEYGISKSYPCYILKENVPARANCPDWNEKIFYTNRASLSHTSILARAAAAGPAAGGRTADIPAARAAAGPAAGGRTADIPAARAAAARAAAARTAAAAPAAHRLTAAGRSAGDSAGGIAARSRAGTRTAADRVGCRGAADRPTVLTAGIAAALRNKIRERQRALYIALTSTHIHNLHRKIRELCSRIILCRHRFPRVRFCRFPPVPAARARR